MQGEMDNEIWIGGSLLVFVQALITELKKKKKPKKYLSWLSPTSRHPQTLASGLLVCAWTY